MTKIIHFIAISLLATQLAFSQSAAVSAAQPLSIYGDGVNMRMMDMPPPPQDLDHSLYLEDEWLPGSILFENNRVIKKCSLKYDIANGYIEIKAENVVKAAPEKDVKQFTFTENDVDRWFMSASLFNNSEKISGKLLEVLVGGEIKLLYLTTVEILKPNGGFVDQRRAGADAITSIKRDKYYLVKGEELMEMDNKKQAMEAFGVHADDMKDWVKQNSLKFGKQDDLKQIVAHYTSLLSVN